MKNVWIILFFCTSLVAQQEKGAVLKMGEKFYQKFNATIHKPTDSATFYLNKLNDLVEVHKYPILKIWKHQAEGYRYFTKNKLDKSLNEYQASLEIAEKEQLFKEIIEAKNWMSNIYILTNKNKKAIQIFKEILKISKQQNFPEGMAMAWTGLANDKSLSISEQLKLNLKIDSLYSKLQIETAILSNTYNWIGSVYLNHYNNENLAVKYYQKSLRIAKNVDYQPGINYVTTLLAEIAVKNKNYQTAKDYYLNLIESYKKFDDLIVATSYNELSIIEFKENNNSKALSYLNKSTVIFNQQNDSSNLMYNNLLRAKINLALKKYEVVKQIIFKLDNTNIRNKNSIYFLIKLNQLKSDYYNKINQFEKALLMYKKADSLRNSIRIKSNDKKFADLETKYQTEKKEQEIDLLKSKNELTIKEKQNQRNILLATIGVVAIAGLFFFFLYENRKKTTKKLQELAQAKSDFFANISHEFRTPLTLIHGPTQKLLAKEQLSTSDEIDLNLIQRNSNRLLSLVNQLLDLSKIKAGNVQLKITQSNVLNFVGSLVDGYTYLIEEKQLEFNSTIQKTKAKTWFDHDILEKLIANLMTNAIKYTPKNGNINCNVFVEKETFNFELKNSGKGLSKKEINHVFDRFFQVDQQKKGVGIGLSLVKELVELHKGNITVESKPNQWTLFKLQLPIQKNKFKENELIERDFELHNEGLNLVFTEEILTENETINEKPILLIVDDNEEIRNYVKSIFVKEYEIILAENGATGIQTAINNIPDLIISDIMMPIKDGIELCNTLKVDERTSHIPIILLTAKTEDEHKLIGLKSGADDYIAKPFNQDLLKLKVEKLLESLKKLQERFSQEIILRPTDVSISSTDELFLDKLQLVLDENLINSDFCVDYFCSEIGMSRMQLHRKIKALFGMTTSAFIRSKRLKLAAILLKKSDANVSQIGYSVGFNDHAYFSKRFKEMFGCTPTTYSKK